MNAGAGRFFLMRHQLTFIFVLCATFTVAGQETVRGRVVDDEDTSGVPYAVVYFSELQKTATCDSNGLFRLEGIPGASQEVVVSRIGYTTTIATVNVYAADNFIYLHKGAVAMEPVLVIGTQTTLNTESVSSTTSITQQQMRASGALSISDGVAHLPGVTQLNTGVGISKPVIRGLYGNRIQTVTLGMRFDNQQWQDEHGLGLQDIGVDRVEVLKGPLSLVYGSEAMGGVINILEENPAATGTTRGDVSMRLFSNTFGASLDAGVKAAKENYFWRIRLGSESHADYSDGNNKRVQNSRFDGHVAKGTFGFNRARWSCVNNYLFSKSDFGFIMDSAMYLPPDDRLARDFEDPHHTVFINMVTTQNSIFLERAILRVNAGAHINRRMEDEGGGGVSLDMQLITGALHTQLEWTVIKNWKWLAGVQSNVQHNANYGWRKIVPDAMMAEASGYFYVKHVSDHKADELPFVFESGVRYDFRSITTFETGSLNTGPFALPAVSKNYSVVNGSAGVNIPFLKVLVLRLNGTTGYRSPNLAELSSNGVHEGTLRYEIGNTAMKVEQNICGDAAIELHTAQLQLSVGGYYNHFVNYIHLVPTDEEWFGFRVYRFIQNDAALKGAEASLDYNPAFIRALTFNAGYNAIRARVADGSYLPFIPADRFTTELRYRFKDSGKRSGLYVRAGWEYYFAQNRAAQFETATPAYDLVDAGAGVTFSFRRTQSVQLDVACNNLLNEVYFDHLSRFKEFSIYNIGRNVTLNFKYNW